MPLQSLSPATHPRSEPEGAIVPRGVLRAKLRAEHAMLAAMLEEAIEDLEDATATWSRFVRTLKSQTAAEDRLLGLLPDARSARVLVHEHRLLRGLVGDVEEALPGSDERARALVMLADVLRAHARNDDRLLYQWADRDLDPAEQRAALAAVSERLASSSA
jgi:hypothetical protein